MRSDPLWNHDDNDGLWREGIGILLRGGEETKVKDLFVLKESLFVIIVCSTNDCTHTKKTAEKLADADDLLRWAGKVDIG